MNEARKRHKNLFMVWLDVKKSYDTVPHDCILHCLSLFGTHKKIIKFLECAMSKWSTVLTVNGVSLGQVDIKCGIFQGDSLSPLLFVMCFAPLSFVLDKTCKGYQFSNSSTLINHLVYMDDIKLYQDTR